MSRSLLPLVSLLVACRAGRVEVEPETIYVRDTGDTPADDSSADHTGDTHDTGAPDSIETGDTADSEDTAGQDTDHTGDTGLLDTAPGDTADTSDTADTTDTGAVDDPETCEAGDIQLVAADLSCTDGLWTAHLQMDGDFDPAELHIEVVGPYAKVAMTLTDDDGCCLTVEYDDEDCTTWGWNAILVYTWVDGTDALEWCASAGEITRYDVSTCENLDSLTVGTCTL